MKRAAEWALYVIGALAISYLALYLYAAFTQPNFQPGDPIHIFRKPDAPNYSAYSPTIDNAQLGRRGDSTVFTGARGRVRQPAFGFFFVLVWRGLSRESRNLSAL